MTRRSMLALALSFALGLGALGLMGWLLGRAADRADVVAAPGADQVTPTRAASSDQAPTRGTSSATAAQPALEAAMQRHRPRLEPAPEDSPQRRKLQQELWRELHRFAAEAELTDAQLEQFVSDVSELAVTEAVALFASLETDGNIRAIWDLNLGSELRARCAAWMTDEQLRVFYFRFDDGNSLVSQVRRLYYYEPKRLPRDS